MPRTSSHSLIIVLLALVLLPAAASAQDVWPRSMDGQSIKLEYLAPSYATSGSGMDLTAYAITLSGRIAVGESSFLVAEIPYLSTSFHFSMSLYGLSFSGSESKSALGNIDVGAEFLNPEAETRGEIGVWLPTMSRSDAFAASGLLLGDIDRMEAYMPTYLTLHGSYAYTPVSDAGLAFLLRVGPSVFIPTEGGSGSKSEVMLDYGIGAGFVEEAFRVGVGISGRLMVTEEKFVGDKKAVHTFEGGFNAKIGPVRPGVFIHVPLDSELSGSLNNTFGAFVSYTF